MLTDCQVEFYLVRRLEVNLNYTCQVDLTEDELEFHQVHPFICLVEQHTKLAGVTMTLKKHVAK